jgi:hypothetical protein
MGVVTNKLLIPRELKVSSTAPVPYSQEYPISNSSALLEVEVERYSILDLPSSAMEGMPYLDHQKEPNCPSLAATYIYSGLTFDINGASYITLLPLRLSSMLILYILAIRIIKIILINCVELNYALIKYRC